jgi:hypothetical protein
MGINVAILSYDGKAYFGFSGDAQAAPDLEQLEKFVSASFDELKKAAGVKRAAPTKPVETIRKKRTKTQAAASRKQRTTSAGRAKAQVKSGVAAPRTRSNASAIADKKATRPVPSPAPMVTDEMTFAQAGD